MKIEKEAQSSRNKFRKSGKITILIEKGQCRKITTEFFLVFRILVRKLRALSVFGNKSTMWNYTKWSLLGCGQPKIEFEFSLPSKWKKSWRKSLLKKPFFRKYLLKTNYWTSLYKFFKSTEKFLKNSLPKESIKIWAIQNSPLNLNSSISLSIPFTDLCIVQPSTKSLAWP